MQDLVDELVGANLVQMPRPGLLQIQTVHATCLRELDSSSTGGAIPEMVSKILDVKPRQQLASIILLLYGGSTARSATPLGFLYLLLFHLY